MKKPNLFIVGTMKAGTTSLYHYLSQHPDIFMCPIKEPNYFCKDIRKKDFIQTQKDRFLSRLNIDKYLSKTPLEKIHHGFIDNFHDYKQLFKEVKNERIIGEVSVSYLYSAQAAKEIFHYNSESKIIIILRNPIDRAYSHWKMNLSGGFEKNNVSFYDAIQNDMNSRIKGYFCSNLYIELGLYYEQVKRYQNIFHNNQILILLFEDFLENKENLINKIFSFLNISHKIIDLAETFNVSTMPRYPIIKKLAQKYRIKKIIPSKYKDKLDTLFTSKKIPKIDQTARLLIYDYYKKDIEELEKLINYDLSKWKLGNC